MSSVYCKVESCDHRSKRRSRSKNKAGEWLYKCTKKDLVIIPYVNGDSTEYESNTVTCLGYCCELE